MITLIYEAENHSEVAERALKDTSGVDGIELIHISGKDLSQEYNKALKSAKHDIVVFLRRGVRICTKDWGRRVVNVFSTTPYGIVGTLGSLIVPMSGMMWEKEEPLCGKIWYEHYTDECRNVFGEDFGDKILDVVTLEGSFFALHKDRITSTFDEDYTGDSFFENDFCIGNYQKGVRVGVVFGIDVLKECFDDQDDDFIENHKCFLNKHKELPYRIIPELIVDEKPLELKAAPSLEIMVANKGGIKELITSLGSVVEKTAYDNYIISVIDYGSTPEEIDQIKEFIKGKENIEFVQTDIPVESMIYNEAVEKSSAELLVFMSKHIHLENDAISLMVETYLKNPDECGTVGLRTHLKNHMVRQFGLQLISQQGEEGMELGLNMNGFGKSYAYRNEVVEGVVGNSIECLLVEKELFSALGGFNTCYMHSLQDFELNLKAILAGRKNTLVGTAVATYMGFDKPKFLPKDYMLLMDFVNKNIEVIAPYVRLISA